MAFADAVARMLDAQYARMGVAAAWTPFGGSAVAFKALEVGTDEAAPAHSLVGAIVVEDRRLRARVSELTALAPAASPAAGDAVTIDGENFKITGDPKRHGARRLEWIFALAAA